MDFLFTLIVLLYQSDCDKMEDGILTEEERHLPEFQKVVYKMK